MSPSESRSPSPAPRLSKKVASTADQGKKIDSKQRSEVKASKHLDKKDEKAKVRERIRDQAQRLLQMEPGNEYPVGGVLNRKEKSSQRKDNNNRPAQPILMLNTMESGDVHAETDDEALVEQLRVAALADKLKRKTPMTPALILDEDMDDTEAFAQYVVPEQSKAAMVNSEPIGVLSSKSRPTARASTQTSVSFELPELSQGLSSTFSLQGHKRRRMPSMPKHVQNPSLSGAPLIMSDRSKTRLDAIDKALEDTVQSLRTVRDQFEALERRQADLKREISDLITSMPLERTVVSHELCRSNEIYENLILTMKGLPQARADSDKLFVELVGVSGPAKQKRKNQARTTSNPRVQTLDTGKTQVISDVDMQEEWSS